MMNNMTVCPECNGDGSVPILSQPKEYISGPDGSVLETKTEPLKTSFLGEDGKWHEGTYWLGPDKRCPTCEGSGKV